MSNTTITLQQTLNWILAFTVQRPNTGVAGIANEPGLTCANKVMQTILSAPFRWMWNRNQVTYQFTGQGGTDFEKYIPDFGYLEKATVVGGTPNAREIEIVNVLAQESKQNPTGKICALFDDNAGNITFRVSPAVDLNYEVVLTYQRSPIIVTSLSGTTWAPIPDRYAFLYEAGMLAHLSLMYSPQLYLANIEMFFRQLVGAAEGLTETERAIFLAEKIQQLQTQQFALVGAQQARQSRA